MDSVALIGPAWLWILAALILLFLGIVMGALACYALKVAAALDRVDDLAAKRSDVIVEFSRLQNRIAALEAPEPLPVRHEPPATIREPLSIELPEDTDVHPCLPWHTSVRP